MTMKNDRVSVLPFLDRAAHSPYPESNAIRELVLSVIEDSTEKYSLSDLFEILGSNGFSEQRVRTAVISMLAEGVIEMTPLRRLRTEAKHGLDINLASQSMACGASAGRR
jgi:hypothetical protein